MNTLQSNINNTAVKPRWVVGLRGLPSEFTEGQIRAFFAGLQVKDLKIVMLGSRSSVESLVEFDDEKTYESALAKRWEGIDFGHIEVLVSTGEDMDMAAAKVDRGAQDVPSEDEKVSRESTPVSPLNLPAAFDEKEPEGNEEDVHGDLGLSPPLTPEVRPLFRAYDGLSPLKLARSPLPFNPFQLEGRHRRGGPFGPVPFGAGPFAGPFGANRRRPVRYMAEVEVMGEASLKMKNTKSATLLCSIVSEKFRQFVERTLANYQIQEGSQKIFGLCTYHKLNTQPWDDRETSPDEIVPDSIMACIRREFAFPKNGCVACEVTFVKDGRVVMVNDVELGPSEGKSQEGKSQEGKCYWPKGESSGYLGVYKTMHESAKPFKIEVGRTNRHMPVIACSEFDNPIALLAELAQRAAHFAAAEAAE